MDIDKYMAEMRRLFDARDWQGMLAFSSVHYMAARPSFGSEEGIELSEMMSWVHWMEDANSKPGAPR